MAFWILNKRNDTPIVCGSVVSVSEVTDISKDTLYDYFSRKKVPEFENETYRIVKLPITRSLRS